jgi:hypothetical protein
VSGRAATARLAALGAAAVLLALVPLACGGDDGPAPTETETVETETVDTTETDAGTTTVSVYLLRGDQLGVARREVPATRAVLRAALEELVTGPSAEEGAWGLGTSIPEGTTVNAVTLDGGIATVDLSDEFDDGGGSLSMSTRLAQVVFTATRFPTVKGVLLELDGVPVTTFSSEGFVLEGPQRRADYEEQAPPILVETPAPGDVVTSPIRLAGSSNTFEATFQYALVAADGTELAASFGTATCGTGCRGTFAVTVRYDAPPGEATLRVFEYSAKDGSVVNLVEIPVSLA